MSQRPGRWLGTRRGWLTAVFVVGVIAAAPLGGSPAVAQDTQFFRIGTGSTGGTYFPVGALLANIISNPPGSRECDKGGSCGVPGLIAVAQSTNGSVDNARAIGDRALESGLIQMDITYWAYLGGGISPAIGPYTNIRVIANLYPEAMQVVVRADGGITGIGELRGKRVAIGKEGSGTLINALAVLEAYGLTLDDFEPAHLTLGQASDGLRNSELDAFFQVAGAPADAVAELAEHTDIVLLPIDGEEAGDLLAKYKFFTATEIDGDVYEGVGRTSTLSVGAVWVADLGVDADLVYNITKALWHPNARALLDNAHPIGKLIRLESALDGIAVPLHPGAARYYDELGLRG